MDISDNIARINNKIKSAAIQAGRSVEEIKLIAVSKKQHEHKVMGCLTRRP